MNKILDLLKRLDWIVISILVFLPIVLSFALIWYSRKYGITAKEATFTIITFYTLTITVGVAIHRFWAHAAFKMNKVLEFIFMLLASATLQGSIIAWSSDHEKHHSFTDTEKDPHTPLKFKNKFLGFFWSHMGWMMVSNKKEITKNTMARLGKNKLLIWQFKYYWQIALFMNTIIPSIIGYISIGGTQGILAGIIFFGIGRALQQQVTFLINSITHFVGDKSHSNGSAGDIWWLFIILFGENWHNFHHTFANDYRNGHKWYHFDVHKWIIFLFYKLGLAWDLVCTSNTRIEAKILYESNNLIKDLELRINNLFRDINNITEAISIVQINKKVLKIKNKLYLFHQEIISIQKTIQESTLSDIKILKKLSKWQNKVSLIERNFLAIKAIS